MKLLTKELEKRFEASPFNSQDGKGMESIVIAKFFGGSACTWLITEAEKQEDGDWHMFGYATLGYEWEWGYVSLNELQSLRFRPFGLGVERDVYIGKNEIVKNLI